jgi:hypothetical protein
MIRMEVLKLNFLIIKNFQVVELLKRIIIGLANL